MSDFAPMRNLLPLYTTTKLNSLAPPAEYVKNLFSDYLLQHSARVDIMPHTRHMAHYVRT